MKFRKKPVIISAIRYKKGLKHKAIIPIYDHMNGRKQIGVGIKTLEGIMEVSEGDWIIKGVNGEFYPCKPDIFEKTYELVKERTQNLRGER